jgi:hypothetical protein
VASEGRRCDGMPTVGAYISRRAAARRRPWPDRMPICVARSRVMSSSAVPAVTPALPWRARHITTKSARRGSPDADLPPAYRSAPRGRREDGQHELQRVTEGPRLLAADRRFRAATFCAARVGGPAQISQIFAALSLTRPTRSVTSSSGLKRRISQVCQTLSLWSSSPMTTPPAPTLTYRAIHHVWDTHGEHFAGTAGGPIPAIMTAVRLGSR